MPYAMRDGLSLYYEQAGSGNPPLVFVHGWCCDHTYFQPQFEHFQTSHSVTTLDLRGCGCSTQSEDGYDIPSLADDIAWLCRDAGIDKPVIVGHSLGGMIGIELAARHPSLPSAIVAVDPGPISLTPDVRCRFESLLSQLEGADGNDVRQAFVRGMFLETDNAKQQQRILETMCAVPLNIGAAVIRGAIDWNGIGAMMLCRAPLLVILARAGGSNDPARLLALKPNVHIGMTVGAGHFNQLDAPEQVNPMIERFLHVVVAA